MRPVSQEKKKHRETKMKKDKDEELLLDSSSKEDSSSVEEVTAKSTKKKKPDAANKTKAKEKKSKHFNHHYEVVVKCSVCVCGERGESEGCLQHQGDTRVDFPPNSCGQNSSLPTKNSKIQDVPDNWRIYPSKHYPGSKLPLLCAEKPSCFQWQQSVGKGTHNQVLSNDGVQ